MSIAAAPSPDLATIKKPSADRLGLRRLRHDRHYAADRRRDAVRGGRSSQQPARPRCRRRERQRDARRGAALRRGCVDRLCRVRYSNADANAPLADRLPVTFQEADAEALPFGDASFDVVLSTFGVMFTPNQAEGSERARPRLPPWRKDRFGGSDAGQLHRPGV